jgi:hypothetical protein
MAGAGAERLSRSLIRKATSLMLPLEVALALFDIFHRLL